MSASKKANSFQIAASHYQHGVKLFDDGQTEQSLPYFKAALEADIQEPNYWLAYITVLVQTERLHEAKQVMSYGLEAGLAGEKINALLQLLEAKLAMLSALQHELIVLFEDKYYAEAEQKVQLALKKYPHWLAGWKILSDTLLIQGKDARIAAKQALVLNIDDAFEHCYFGLVLKNQGDLIGAAKAFEQAITLKPDYAAAYNNLGIVKKDLGDVAAAIQYYRQALVISPNYTSCYSNYLFCLTHSEKVEQKALFDAHMGFGKQYETALKKHWQPHLNQRKPDKSLNIGFVSADFRAHSVAYFFEPLLNQLAKSGYLNLYAYASSATTDATTLRIKQQFKYWAQVDTLSDDALAGKIRTDQIDILVDLSGHTANNRLMTFALKPAPVQISWLGYLATTGLSAMDYYFADTCSIPNHTFNKQILNKQFIEKIVRLPANAPFMPSDLAPAVNALPASYNGYITFACFNRPSKISTGTVKLWSNLLHAVPNSKMLLGAMPEVGSYDHLINSFSTQGITNDRLIFHPQSNLVHYLSLYQQVDLCLDTFPSNGVTTTCHAAWMGVPTLCITGKTLASRGAMAVMQHANLNNFIAQNAEQFIQQGVHFSQNIEMLEYVRSTLRNRMTQSALLQPEMLANSVELAFRQIWATWCANKPVTSFEIKA